MEPAEMGGVLQVEGTACTKTMKQGRVCWVQGKERRIETWQVRWGRGDDT